MSEALKPKGIIIHCSDSPSFRGDNAKTIHKWHLNRGWNGIGYHYIISENGIVEKGRPEFWQGAHARGYNKTHLGICLIGKDCFTRPQMNSLSILCLELMLKYKFQVYNIIGHYEANENKTCPNFNIDNFKEKYFYQKDKNGIFK